MDYTVRAMNKRESTIILGFLLLLLIPVLWLTYESVSKISTVFIFHRNDYVITQSMLTKNVCKKYGGGARFDINYKGDTVEGSDGCRLFADKGDFVKIYFNKNNLYDNGIVKELITLCCGRIFLLLVLSILFFKRVTKYHHL